MIDPPPSSSLVRFFLGTKYVRHYARRLINIYENKTDDELILKEIFKERVYERYFPLEESSVVVDVGANSGYFTLRASKMLGNSGQVLAFEPFSKSFCLLQKHALIEGSNSITGSGRHWSNIRLRWQSRWKRSYEAAF